MNTRQLRHFLAVIDHRSLSAAAQAVNLSQPALSRSLRALEDELRVPLFDRQDRRLRPTPYAQSYVERARRMVREEREGARDMLLMRGGEVGALAFGMGSSIALTLLGPMVLQLLAAAPRLRLQTLVQSSDVLVAALRREQLDFFIGDIRIAAADSDLSVHPVHACRLGWFARRGHPLAGRTRIGVGELAAYPWIGSGYADEAIARAMARLYGLALPLEHHFSVNTNDVATVHSLLGASDAIAPATDVAMVSAVRAGTMVLLDVDPAPAPVELPLGIVERASRTRVPAAERAYAIVRAHFEAVAQEVARQYRHSSAARADRHTAVR
jgi:DNA-binding transcriptional LysR family regulator